MTTNETTARHCEERSNPLHYEQIIINLEDEIRRLCLHPDKQISHSALYRRNIRPTEEIISA